MGFLGLFILYILIVAGFYKSHPLSATLKHEKQKKKSPRSMLLTSLTASHRKHQQHVWRDKDCVVFIHSLILSHKYQLFVINPTTKTTTTAAATNTTTTNETEINMRFVSFVSLYLAAKAKNRKKKNISLLNALSVFSLLQNAKQATQTGRSYVRQSVSQSVSRVCLYV